MKILRLLRILGKNDPDASEAMNDILAQVIVVYYYHFELIFFPKQKWKETYHVTHEFLRINVF